MNKIISQGLKWAFLFTLHNFNTDFVEYRQRHYTTSEIIASVADTILFFKIIIFYLMKPYVKLIIIKQFFLQFERYLSKIKTLFHKFKSAMKIILIHGLLHRSSCDRALYKLRTLFKN